MAVEFKSQDYTTSKNILLFPDHYVSVAHTFHTSDGTDVDGKKIVKAGTVYPANDDTAQGVVWADYDVTNGDVTGALIVHGFIKAAALPEPLTDEAKGVLSMIQFR